MVMLPSRKGYDMQIAEIQAQVEIDQRHHPAPHVPSGRVIEVACQGEYVIVRTRGTTLLLTPSQAREFARALRKAERQVRNGETA